jgi:hypothetical protein
MELDKFHTRWIGLTSCPSARAAGQTLVLVISVGCYRFQPRRRLQRRTPADLAGWLGDSAAGGAQRPLNVAVCVAAIRSYSSTQGWGGLDFPRAGQLAPDKAAGIDPASVTDAVLTHMHMDHVGGCPATGRVPPESDLRVTWRAPKPSSGRPPVSRTHMRRGAGRLRSAATQLWTSTAASYGGSDGCRWRRGARLTYRRHTPGHSVVR